ncbi:MAG: hydrogenase nickel incorporation protein HypB, partial [Candidatus Latescibacteria bacterium]|nr:hydrogenase nickel incorporation protein HypB [Candidatus Latescibacterota bacterium]
MTEISLKSKVMKKNDRIAENLRSMLHKHTIFGLNLIGSPGSGKTTLLEAVLPGLIKKLHCGVIEGDVKTDNDMKRIAALGVPAVQIETQGSCHLNAEMVLNAIDRFSLPSLDMLIIENVGNLICPVSYDLGEDYRVIVLSITEGDDKPLKYPSAFIFADVLVITKIDLEPYVDANVETMKSNALSLNPGLKVFK